MRRHDCINQSVLHYVVIVTKLLLTEVSDTLLGYNEQSQVWMVFDLTISESSMRRQASPPTPEENTECISVFSWKPDEPADEKHYTVFVMEMKWNYDM